MVVVYGINEVTKLIKRLMKMHINDCSYNFGGNAGQRGHLVNGLTGKRGHHRWSTGQPVNAANVQQSTLENTLHA